MANIRGIQIEGDKEFMEIINLMPDKMAPRVMRDIARKGGRVIVKAARKKNRIPGQLGKHFNREMIVGNDKQSKRGVVVTVRGGRGSRMMVNSQGKNYIPSAVGRHMTEGANQEVRKTKGKGGRGKVSNRYPDPIELAALSDGSKAMEVMQQETKAVIEKHIQKLKKK
ncbi:MAG: hypothetical protein WAZ98_03905 [Cyclobacteriaceae bacterium]